MSSTLCVCVCVRVWVSERDIFTHSSVEGHLGCFLILAIINNAAMTIGMCVSFQISVFVFFSYIPRSEIPGSVPVNFCWMMNCLNTSWLKTVIILLLLTFTITVLAWARSRKDFLRFCVCSRMVAMTGVMTKIFPFICLTVTWDISWHYWPEPTYAFSVWPWLSHSVVESRSKHS